ncbi:hypothetical protein ACIQRK_00565 [Streptomyces anulatus]
MTQRTSTSPKSFLPPPPGRTAPERSPAQDGREATGFTFVDLRKVRGALGLTGTGGKTGAEEVTE